MRTTIRQQKYSEKDFATGLEEDLQLAHRGARDNFVGVYKLV
jgi:hypothetical protein